MQYLPRCFVFFRVNAHQTNPTMPLTDNTLQTILQQERARLGRFIRQRVSDPGAAEDILQEVLFAFVQAWRLPEPIEQAGAWLMQVARHRIIDRFRKQREVPLSQAGSDGDEEAWLDSVLPDSRDGPEALYARKGLLTAIEAALGELPVAQREVFVAHELDGESFRDMALRTGVALNTLLARKRYAVQYLRRRLQDFYDDLQD